MNQDRSLRRVQFLLAAVLVPVLAAVWWSALELRSQATQDAVVEFEEKSAYSKIRVTRAKNLRTLWFIRESGEAITESLVDIDKPHELQLEYTRYMFASYLFRTRPAKVLLVGLGGGAMVHFLKHHDPQVKIDVVEIDPVIVKVADKFFGVRSGGNVNIINKDGLAYLKTAEARYDVIYMDAFLKPAADTDSSGVPLRLKTIQFYKEVQKRLTADGLVLYNLHPHEKAQDDMKNVAEAFPQSYVFRLPNFRSYVLVGALAAKRLEPATLRRNAEEAEGRLKPSFSLRDMVERLAPP